MTSMIRLSNNWGTVPSRFRHIRFLAGARIHETLLYGAEEQVKFAKLNLERLVYDRMDTTAWPRSRRTINAVKVHHKGEMEVQALVDPHDFDGFFYAMTIEHGSSNWYWWGRRASRPYPARPFWKPAQALAEKATMERARLALREIKQGF